MSGHDDEISADVAGVFTQRGCHRALQQLAARLVAERLTELAADPIQIRLVQPHWCRREVVAVNHGELHLASATVGNGKRSRKSGLGQSRTIDRYENRAERSTV